MDVPAQQAEGVAVTLLYAFHQVIVGRPKIEFHVHRKPRFGVFGGGAA